MFIIKLPRSDVSEEIIRGAPLYGELHNGGSSKTADGFQTLSIVDLFISTQLDLYFAKNNNKAMGGCDDKIKLVLFEYFIAFISILQYMVNWLKLF